MTDQRSVKRLACRAAAELIYRAPPPAVLSDPSDQSRWSAAVTELRAELLARGGAALSTSVHVDGQLNMDDLIEGLIEKAAS